MSTKTDVQKGAQKDASLTAWTSTLNMFIKNVSGKTLMAYYITHQCGGQATTTLKGTNLANGAQSAAVATKSESGSNDNYTVALMWDDGHQGKTSFYCNCSSDDASVNLIITSADLDCNYYESNNASGVVDSNCENKGSWTA